MGEALITRRGGGGGSGTNSILGISPNISNIGSLFDDNEPTSYVEVADGASRNNDPIMPNSFWATHTDSTVQTFDVLSACVAYKGTAIDSSNSKNNRFWYATLHMTVGKQASVEIVPGLTLTANIIQTTRNVYGNAGTRWAIEATLTNNSGYKVRFYYSQPCFYAFDAVAK